MRIQKSIRRRVAACAGALLAVAGVVTMSATPAQAADPVPIGAGAPFGKGTPLANGTNTTADHCTIAAVGRDSANRLVALTAGHCARDTVSGELVGLYIDDQKVGQFVSAFDNSPNPQYLPGYYDFAFATLDESKVTVASQRGANVSAGLLGPTEMINTFTSICKTGMTTGYGCGTYIGNGGTNPRSHISTLSVAPGDSGGPMFTPGGKLVGIASKGTQGAPVSYYTDVRDASAYAASKGWVGGGFQPIG